MCFNAQTENSFNLHRNNSNNNKQRKKKQFNSCKYYEKRVHIVALSSKT